MYGKNVNKIEVILAKISDIKIFDNMQFNASNILSNQA